MNDDGESLLVKPDVAQAQIDVDAKARADREGKTQDDSKKKEEKNESEEKEVISPQKKARRFFGTAEMDPKKARRDAGNIAEAIIQHPEQENGAKVRVTMEIETDIPSGAGERTLRTVSENCRTLKFKQLGFEKD
jgi:hypothetical protein